MYTIITDSCCDLNSEIINAYKDFRVLPLSYTIGGVTHTEMPEDEEVSAYYDRLRSGEVSSTSQINPYEFYEVFVEYVKRGESLLCLHFSSALSGTCASAVMARNMVLQEYPDAKIEVVDTLAASAGQGMMVCDVLDNRDAGMSLEENAQWIRERIQNYAQWFTVDDLHFLQRGGRCSPSAAFFGTMLSIKPVLHVNAEGKLIAREKVRGRKQALKALADKYGELGMPKDQRLFISHGDCEEDALILKGILVEKYGCDPDKIVLSFVGPVIGSHSGPGTVAFFFRGKDRG